MNDVRNSASTGREIDLTSDPEEAVPTERATVHLFSESVDGVGLRAVVLVSLTLVVLTTAVLIGITFDSWQPVAAVAPISALLAAAVFLRPGTQ